MLVLLLCLLFAQAALPTANFQRGLGSGGKGLKDIELTAQTPTEALRAARMARQINRGRRSIRLLRQATERWPDCVAWWRRRPLHTCVHGVVSVEDCGQRHCRIYIRQCSKRGRISG